MRARNLKPGFFKNDKLAELDPLCRILFEGLWCMADRAGRLENRPKRIKAEVLPYDECDIEQFLQDLDNSGFIILYSKNNSNYIQIINFEKHQNPHCKEKESEIPEPDPDKHNASTIQAQCKNSESTEQARLIPDSGFLIPVQVHSSSGDEAGGDEGSEDETKIITSDKKILKGEKLKWFLDFWDAFAHKQGRAEAAGAWLKIRALNRKIVYDEIIPAARAEAQRRDGLVAKGRTPKMAQGWITGRRWEDEGLVEQKIIQHWEEKL